MHVKTVRFGSGKGFARQFAQSLRETGFAVLTDHPIPARLISDTYAEWERFFASQEKEKHVFKQETQAGYFPFRTENAKNTRIKDLKEFYHHYPERKELPSGVRAHTPELYSKLLELGSTLLEWIEEETPA